MRGEYGSGKTFFLQYLGARARAAGFATAYVRISAKETPLHKPLTVYQAIAAGVAVQEKRNGALRHILDQWLFSVGDRIADPALGEPLSPEDPGYDEALEKEIRTMLGPVAEAAPSFAQALSGYASASIEGEHDLSLALLSWLGGDAHKVDRSAKRYARLAGRLDNSDVPGLLRGLSQVIVQAGYRGLVLLVDEVERLVRMPSNLARSGLEVLQNWIGALDSGELVHVLMVVAGTTTFFESPRGVPLLEPLQQRVGMLDDGPFPDLDAVQIRLPAFDVARLHKVGVRVRDIYRTRYPEIEDRLDENFLHRLAEEIAGAFKGKVEVTPRRYLRELITVLGRVRQHPTYLPHEHFAFKITASEPTLSEEERAVLEGSSLTTVETSPLSEEFDL